MRKISSFSVCLGHMSFDHVLVFAKMISCICMMFTTKTSQWFPTMHIGSFIKGIKFSVMGECVGTRRVVQTTHILESKWTLLINYKENFACVVLPIIHESLVLMLEPILIRHVHFLVHIFS